MINQLRSGRPDSSQLSETESLDFAELSMEIDSTPRLPKPSLPLNCICGIDQDSDTFVCSSCSTKSHSVCYETPQEKELLVCYSCRRPDLTKETKEELKQLAWVRRILAHLYDIGFPSREIFINDIAIGT